MKTIGFYKYEYYPYYTIGSTQSYKSDIQVPIELAEKYIKAQAEFERLSQEIQDLEEA